MKFYMPTKLYLEKDCVYQHRKELAALGSRALLVTGRHSARINGAYDDVVKSLEDQGVSYSLFDEIEENPSVETVARAAFFGREQKADFVIGIGGGSPMDAAKAIALLMNHPEEEPSVLYEKKELEALPVAAVPTTAGTGSEVTPYAILTLHELQTKKSMSHHVFPVLSLADAKYLTFAGRELLIHTAVDTLAHLIESHLNKNTTEYSRLFSARGLKLWGEIKEALSTGELSGGQYEKLMRTSTLGGMSISHTGTSFPHGMSYYLTYHMGVPHGKAVGIFLPAFLELYGTKEPAEVRQVLEYLNFDGADPFREYMQQILGIIKVTGEQITSYANGMMANKAKLANFPYPVTLEQMRELFEKSLAVQS